MLERQIEDSLRCVVENLKASPTPGAVPASLSKVDPNYFFHWVRDAAITVNELVYWQENHLDIQEFIEASRQFSRQLRKFSKVREGFGEPRFLLTGEMDNSTWPRPQFDGPALRALEEIATCRRQACQDISSIQADLEAIVVNWRRPGYDLWEESYGYHFFNFAVQAAALRVGSQFFQQQGHGKLAQIFQSTARQIADLLPKFWDSERKIFRPTLYDVGDLGFAFPNGLMAVYSELKFMGKKRTQADIAVVLAFLVDPDLQKQLAPRALESVQSLERAFVNVFPIGKSEGSLLFMGRYPEDTYDGIKTASLGNPWYLSQAAMAQFYYQQVAGLQASQEFLDHGDRYLNVILKYHGPGGSLAEELDRGTGRPTGATDLTWSHIAFLSAARTRQQAINSFKY